MSNTQMFLATVGVVTIELLLVVVFLFRLRERLDRLEESFTNHFHGAGELLGFTDPPIMPTDKQ
jgi:hypothetical protein